MRFTQYTLVLPLLVALPLVGGVTGGPAEEASPATVQEREDVRVRHARFWRPTNRSTLVEAIIGLTVVGDASAAAGPSTRDVRLIVTDASGQQIHSAAWTDTVSATARQVALAQGSVELTEQLRVALLPGAYDFHVIVASAQGRDSTVTRVEAFEDAPLLSDVMVSGGIRLLDGTNAASSAEVVKGDYAIEGGSRVTLLPTRSELWYYLELYADDSAEPTETRLDFRVESATGSGPSVELDRGILLAPPGAVDAAKLDLTGMPPGDYRLVVTATAADGRSDRRSADFSIGAFGTGPVVAQAAPAGGALTEPQLYDRYFAPAVMDSALAAHMLDALLLAPVGPSVDGSVDDYEPEAQRRFLARYFSRLGDPVPVTRDHELVEEYRDRVAYVEREYRERDIGRPGMQTDRGRIYLRYGAPDDRLQAPMTQGKAVEAWRYSRQRNLKFVFLDETGFQHYNLIYADDPNEQTLPDWEQRVGDRDVVNQIKAF